MAVLIDMEMPLNCAGCRFTADGWCYAVGILGQPGHINTNIRPDWCPLVEVSKVKVPLTDKELEDCNFEL